MTGNALPAHPPVQPTEPVTFEELAKAYKLAPSEKGDALRWFLLGQKYAHPSVQPTLDSFIAAQRHLPPEAQKIISEKMSNLLDGDPPVQPTVPPQFDVPAWGDVLHYLRDQTGLTRIVREGIAKIARLEAQLAAPVQPTVEQVMQQIDDFVNAYYEGRSDDAQYAALEAAVRKLAGLTPADSATVCQERTE